MTCPICARATDPQFRPFCSRRCADVDLGRWLRGSYVIPGPPLDQDELHDAPPEADSPPRH